MAAAKAAIAALAATVMLVLAISVKRLVAAAVSHELQLPSFRISPRDLAIFPHNP